MASETVIGRIKLANGSMLVLFGSEKDFGFEGVRDRHPGGGSIGRDVNPGFRDGGSAI